MDYTSILDTILQAVQDSDTTQTTDALLVSVQHIEQISEMILYSIWVIWIADRFVLSGLKQIFGTIS